MSTETPTRPEAPHDIESSEPRAFGVQPPVEPVASEQNRLERILFRSFLSLTVVSLVLFLALLTNFLNTREQATQVAKTNASLIIQRSAEEIDLLLKSLMPLGDRLARDLSEGKVDQQELQARLRKILDINHNIHGAGAAFVPFASDPNVRLFAPTYLREGERIHFKSLEAEIDYTDQEHDWFNIPIANRSATWTEPKFDVDQNTMLARYSVPFYKTGGVSDRKEPAGVVTLYILLNRIKDLVSSLDLGKTGYGYILSKKGAYLSHPIEKYVKTESTLFDIAEATGDDTLRLVGAHAITHESGSVEHVNPTTGQSSWIFFEPVHSTGWSMVVVFVREELASNREELRQQVIWMAISAIAFLSFLSVLITGAWKGNPKRIWAVALTISLLFLSGISLIWLLTIQDPISEPKRNITIVDKAGLDNFLASLTKSSIETNSEAPRFIPTGIFVQSMQFANANNTILTGYIWQRYIKGEHDDIERGFIFPDMSSADDMEINEQFRRTEGNTEVVSWFFRVVMRERFDYSQYPFDKANVWLRVWSKDFNRNVILIPDLDAYTLINPASLPGLEKDLFLPGWTFEQSYFDYKYNSYNTDFGKVTHQGQEDLPELYFNIVTRRNFLGPFISNLIPLIVVAFMLFGLLMIATKHDEKSTWLNFNAQDILASCAALVFVIILAHIDLRGTLAAEGILYLEYFYFVMYITTLLITINAILFSWDVNVPLIRYRDNLIPKLLFWPIITGSLLVITLFIFY